MSLLALWCFEEVEKTKQFFDPEDIVREIEKNWPLKCFELDKNPKSFDVYAQGIYRIGIFSKLHPKSKIRIDNWPPSSNVK